MSFKIYESKKLNSLMEELLEYDASYWDGFLTKHADYYDATTTDSDEAFKAGFRFGIWATIRRQPMYKVQADGIGTVHRLCVNLWYSRPF
jgi:hypothetical protein